LQFKGEAQIGLTGQGVYSKGVIKFTLLSGGFCRQPEFIIMRDGRRQVAPIPALFALLEHPRRGRLLFDTGYSLHFFNETVHWPYSLYPRLTPVELDPAQTALAQLQARGIAAEQVTYIIISHFHADHIAGLADFPQARFIYLAEAYAAVRQRRGLGALRAGFLPGLLPPDFAARSIPLTPNQFGPYLPAGLAPFQRAIDLFGDRSLLAVALPGHANGQMGLFFQTDQGQTLFLIADACWHSRAYRDLIRPHPLANLILAQPGQYQETLLKLHRLHQLNPDLVLIPSHCREIYDSHWVESAPGSSSTPWPRSIL
jgi:glyoxylase-like metal-dependent hydrolase (beta-lactamase superfamily II)